MCAPLHVLFAEIAAVVHPSLLHFMTWAAMRAVDSEDIRAQLKDERLQELIRRIDTAPDRETVLFVCRLLLEAGTAGLCSSPALQKGSGCMHAQVLKTVLQEPDFAGFSERVLSIVSPPGRRARRAAAPRQSR